MEGSGEGEERKEVQLVRWNQKYGWIIWANCQRDVGVAVALVDFLIMGPMYVEEQDGSFMWEGIREGSQESEE
jgi:hypothetical protein